jgi:hypothetical protein
MKKNVCNGVLTKHIHSDVKGGRFVEFFSHATIFPHVSMVAQG